jgi:(5-formylfuran-3-yl)methyl phosphate synthase
MSQLLISVRSVPEALAALEGGAAIIDVKEPARGALGRADDDVIRAVCSAVGARRPVSAALGEWADRQFKIPDARLTYVKWGLAGCRRTQDWRQVSNCQTNPTRVFVAYGDFECAAAPSIEEVFSLAAQTPNSVLLVDTHCKDANNVINKTKPTLLDWLPPSFLVDLCERCRAAKVKIALAGSLGAAEIGELIAAQPDWFAVRGAACAGADRQTEVQVEKVRELVRLLQCAS